MKNYNEIINNEIIKNIIEISKQIKKSKDFLLRFLILIYCK